MRLFCRCFSSRLMFLGHTAFSRPTCRTDVTGLNHRTTGNLSFYNVVKERSGDKSRATSPGSLMTQRSAMSDAHSPGIPKCYVHSLIQFCFSFGPQTVDAACATFFLVTC
jgi:hypothetical protein